MLEDSNIPISILYDIKQLGAQLSLDDFETGYSNLGYLKRLSIDKLKIDRSFIRDIGADSGNDAMVQAIMGIARHLQIAVVAEGVENAEQLAFLREHGCDQYQDTIFPDHFRRIRWMTLIPRRGPAPRRPCSRPGPLLYNVTVNRFRSFPGHSDLQYPYTSPGHLTGLASRAQQSPALLESANAKARGAARADPRP